MIWCGWIVLSVNDRKPQTVGLYRNAKFTANHRGSPRNSKQHTCSSFHKVASMCTKCHCPNSYACVHPMSVHKGHLQQHHWASWAEASACHGSPTQNVCGCVFLPFIHPTSRNARVCACLCLWWKTHIKKPSLNGSQIPWVEWSDGERMAGLQK